MMLYNINMNKLLSSVKRHSRAIEQDLEIKALEIHSRVYMIKSFVRLVTRRDLHDSSEE